MPSTLPAPRLASIDDLDRLVEGNLRLAQETEDLALDEAVLRRGARAVLEARQPGRYYVVEQEGRVVAQLLITFEWSDWRDSTVWWIQSVYTWPEVRGQGFFRHLFLWVDQEARAAQAAGLRLYVDRTNDAAQAVYGRLGMDGEHYRVFEMMF